VEANKGFEINYSSQNISFRKFCWDNLQCQETEKINRDVLYAQDRLRTCMFVFVFVFVYACVRERDSDTEWEYKEKL
jgi:hypothetical protein